MSKNTIRFYAVLALVLVAFSVIVFVVPFVKNAVFWVSYVFAVIAICAQAYVQSKAFNSGMPARSKFYGFPIGKIGLVYLIAQLILSILFMALGAYIPVWISVVVFVLLFCAAAIGFIAVDATRDEVVRQDEKLKVDVNRMRALQSKASHLVSLCKTPEARKAVLEVSDALKYSDPVSSDATREAENNLASVIDMLQSAIVDDDIESIKTLCKDAIGSISERNRICKLNK